ncbi:SEC14-like protein 2 [Aplysia californica]|uniref:SEC14-like protein 2 n=1 Tax=Aplysia californica TaxID=6500 RepID=A0ABM0ZVD9_APLCA|nr:SEC14-like protein 2 [Aplysia californica]
MEHNKAILRDIEQSVVKRLKLEEELKAKEEKRRNKKVKSPKIFPEGKETEIPKETHQDRLLRHLRSRLRPLARHPVFGPRLDQSDNALIKWLDAAENNVFLAASKIRKCLEFRRDMELDDILVNFDPPGVLVTYYPGGFCGVDKQGSPVSYEMLGLLDLMGIMASVSRQDLFKYRLYQYELITKELKRLSSQRKSPVDNILVVVDMRGTGREIMWGPGLVFWAEVIQLVQNYYPGLVKEIVVIHPPPIYPEIYLAFRPYFNRRLRERITVLGANYFQHLLKRIEKHEIPAFLGGYRCDFDGNSLCRTSLNWHSHVPKWTHFTNAKMAADVLDLHILGGCRQVKELHVPAPDSRLLWEFHELSQPVVLLVYKDRLDDPTRLVFPKTTVTMESKYRNYGLVCSQAGRYLMVFDNSKNMAHPLKLRLRIETSPPETLAAKVEPWVPFGDTVDFYEPMSEREKQMAYANRC